MSSDVSHDTRPVDDEYADLDLITDYLQRRLPRKRAAEVERRLEEDEAFREFSWPLILAWSVPRPSWRRTGTSSRSASERST